MIETYYKKGIKVTDIMITHGRSKQTAYNVINFLKDGHSAYDYYEHYKVNMKRFGRRKMSLSQAEKDFIQTRLDQSWGLDVIKGTYPDRIFLTRNDFINTLEDFSVLFFFFPSILANLKQRDL